VTERLRATQWCELLLDPGAQSLDQPPHGGNPLAWPGYDDLRAEAPGDESVQSWAGRADGMPVVLIAFDFAHLGGSMGAGAGARIAHAFAEATRRRLPVVTVTATGGARMQEGMVSLSQMSRTTLAAQAHRNSGQLQLVIATDPTTGGVYVSFAARADLLVAEPSAYVAFAGPRVVASLGGSAEAADANRAEALHEHGLIDAVIPRGHLKAWLARTLSAVVPAVPVPQAPQPVHAATTGAWDRVIGARDDTRARADAYVAQFTHVTAFNGDRAGGRDSGVTVALGRLYGRPVGLVALHRDALTPHGYRTAWRLFDVVARLGIPLVTIVDTPGASPAREDELAGQSRAIAETFDRLLALPVPTVSLVSGEGGSGGALALASTDRLLMQRGAIFSVIAPEGAAAILYRDASRAAEVADLLKPTAEQLVALGIAHDLVPDDPAAALAHVAAALDELDALDSTTLLAQRQAHWASVGRG